MNGSLLKGIFRSITKQTKYPDNHTPHEDQTRPHVCRYSRSHRTDRLVPSEQQHTNRDYIAITIKVQSREPQGHLERRSYDGEWKAPSRNRPRNDHNRSARERPSLESSIQKRPETARRPRKKVRNKSQTISTTPQLS